MQDLRLKIEITAGLNQQINFSVQLAYAASQVKFAFLATLTVKSIKE